jgi:cytochrome c-type biogenesis protein CcmH/NrfG
VFCIGCNVSSDSAKRNYVAKGDRLYASGKYADAVLNYKKAIRKDATFGDAYYKLGLAEIARQSYRDAFQAFYRASELDPANTDAKIKLADLALSFYLSDVQHPKFLYEQFTKVARELLKKQPKSYDALRLNGELARVEKDIKGASDFFRRANEVKPMQPELILSYTQVLFLDGRLAEGEKLALELMEKNKNFGAIYDVLATHYIAA